MKINWHEPNIFDLNPPPQKAPLPPRVPFGRRKATTPPPFWRPDVNKG